MDDRPWLTKRFEEQRPHLRAVVYRMLGSVADADADDAVQEAWIRIDRTDTSDVENLGGWLTTVVARISLNLLRSRQTRREDSLEVHMCEPVVGPAAGSDPEQAALPSPTRSGLRCGSSSTRSRRPSGSRSCCTTSSPSHRTRSPSWSTARPTPPGSSPVARDDASRAPRRSRTARSAAQRDVVDVFFAAGRAGDFDALVAVLHRDVVLHADFAARGGGVPSTATGAASVANPARMFADALHEVHPATVNGAAGVVIHPRRPPDVGDGIDRRRRPGRCHRHPR